MERRPVTTETWVHPSRDFLGLQSCDDHQRIHMSNEIMNVRDSGYHVHVDNICLPVFPAHDLHQIT